MADKIVQLTDKDNNNIFPVTQKNITMTDADPGEGASLSADNYVAVYSENSSLLDFFYPVGTYYETSNTAFNPNTTWGGTWVEDTNGRVLVAKDSGTFATIGKTGGEETHKLVLSEIPAHSHAIRSGYSETSPGSDAYRFQYWGGNNLGWKTGDLGTNSQGGSGSHNNLQPYIVVKRWHRIA